MDLSPEQKKAIATWVTAGDSLSLIQSKLSEQFKISMTYMDLRFLVDDMNLALQDKKEAPKPAEPAKAAGAEAKAAQEKKSFFDKMKEKVGLGDEEQAPAEEEELPPEEDLEEAVPPAGGSVRVSLDSVTLIPSALASGSVVFSDGVTGKWIVDQYGRPGFTEISQKGYRPTPADAQAFMQELNLALQNRGF